MVCNSVGSTTSQEAAIRSFSLFTFFSPPAASAVPTLLPASLPEACCPMVLDSAASVRAVRVSLETGGGFPVTGPVFSPTEALQLVSDPLKVVLKLNYSLGLAEAELVAILALGELKVLLQSVLRTKSVLIRSFDVLSVFYSRTGKIE
jgi:hypothetical protein